MLQQMQNKQRQTLMDNYDYVMFGRIFKYEDTPSGASNQVKASPDAVTSCHQSIPEPPCYLFGHPEAEMDTDRCSGLSLRVFLALGPLRCTNAGHHGHSCDNSHYVLSALCWS